MELEDIVYAAEVSEHPDGRLAVFAERFDNAVIADAVRLVGLEGSHSLRIYLAALSLSTAIFEADHIALTKTQFRIYTIGRANPVPINRFSGFNAKA
jgi:hypothetical protein